MGKADAHRRSSPESVGSLNTVIEIGTLLDRGRWTPYQKLLTALAGKVTLSPALYGGPVGDPLRI